jgi:hypothetical protein
VCCTSASISSHPGLQRSVYHYGHETRTMSVHGIGANRGKTRFIPACTAGPVDGSPVCRRALGRWSHLAAHDFDTPLGGALWRELTILGPADYSYRAPADDIFHYRSDDLENVCTIDLAFSCTKPNERHVRK